MRPKIGQRVEFNVEDIFFNSETKHGTLKTYSHDRKFAFVEVDQTDRFGLKKPPRLERIASDLIRTAEPATEANA